MVKTEDITSEDSGRAELVRRAFGEVLARRREAANLKQRTFSRIVGISNSHLRALEAGNVSPTLVTLWKIAATLETDPSDLVDETSQRLALLSQSDAKSSAKNG